MYACVCCMCVRACVRAPTLCVGCVCASVLCVRECVFVSVCMCACVYWQGLVAVTGSDDKMARVWNISNGQCLRVISLALPLTRVWNISNGQ